MILRLALRSLLTRPVRSAVLAFGFGFGIAVMAALLGVGEVILEQARSPALQGGGDVAVSGSAGSVPSARFFLSSVLGSHPLAGRPAAAAPSSIAGLYLVQPGQITRVDARGEIPDLERRLGDPETVQIPAWTDSPEDRHWSSPDPSDVLRTMDRFHPIPDLAAREGSWAEWLYFNGRSADGSVRFYLTFLVGPRTAPGRRGAFVRVQLDRAGKVETFSEAGETPEAALLAEAPDMEIGGSRVRLEGLTYKIDLNLPAEQPKGLPSGQGGGTAAVVRGETAAVAREAAVSQGATDHRSGRGPGARAGRHAAIREPADMSRGRNLLGEIRLSAVPGRSIPPFSIRGAAGWISGYTVPVLAGPVSGRFRVGSESIAIESGIGYHDHNWGFWEGVTWQWGQVAHEDLSIVYGRLHPPADAADPDRIPGFLGVLGPEGLLGFSTSVEIEEREVAPPDGSQPQTIRVHARGERLDVQMEAQVESAVRTQLGGENRIDTSRGRPRSLGGSHEGPGPPKSTPSGSNEVPQRPLTFFQLRARFLVSGRVGDRSIDFTAPGSAETFRGN